MNIHGRFVMWVNMLKSCKYCCRIHDDKYICPSKAARVKRENYRHDTSADKFRRSTAWTKMSRRVRERDFYICLCCADGIAKDDGTYNNIETEDISVHHIIPIEEDYSLRLDESNLISVCGTHHRMCECGEISRDRQRCLVKKSIERRDENAQPVA